MHIILLNAFLPMTVWSADSKVKFMTYEILRHDVDPQQALNMIDSIFTGYTSNLSTTEESLLLKRQAELAMSIGSYSTASAAFEKLKGRHDDFSFEDALRMDLDAGICNYYSGEYAAAISSALEVLAERKPDSLKDLDLGAYILLSNVSNRIGASEESLKYLDKAQAIAGNLDSDSLRRVAEYRILLGRSSRCLTLEDYRGAYEYLLKSDSLGVRGVAPYCLETNLAIVYSFEKADDMAERYYKAILNSNGVHYNKSVALNNYADFLMNHERIDEALEIMDINLPQLKTVDATHALGIRQVMRFQALAAKGELESSIECADSALNIMMDLMSQESRRTYAQVYGKFETDRTYNELAKKINENTRLYVIIGILSLTIICSGIWIWSVYKERHKMNLKLEKDRSEMAGIHRDYLERIDHMREELDIKNRELTKLELKNSQMSTKLNNIANNPILHGKDYSGLTEGIRTEINDLSRYGSDWNAFEKYFGQVHPDFYEILTLKHPDLTAGERRMCAFIMTGMKTSEIATLCSRSARTVESMKYRLKKKLCLGSEMSLDNYLYSLKN